MTRVEIDPNVRLDGGRTFVGLDDVYGHRVHRGETVEVFQGEWLTGVAVVDDIDYGASLIYLRLDWAALKVR